MKSTKDIVLRRVLVGHRATVNVVEFDEKYIVSGSGDRTIKVCSGGGKERGLTEVPLRAGLTCNAYLTCQYGTYTPMVLHLY